MKLKPKLTALVLCLLAQACSYVTSTDPVGDTAYTIEDSYLEGSWNADGDTSSIQAIDPGKDLYRLEWWNYGQQQQIDILLLSFSYPDADKYDPGKYPDDTSQWVFWNARVAAFNALEPSGDQANKGEEKKKDANPDHWYWGRVLFRDKQILVWDASARAIAPLVKHGTLPGEVERDNVQLGKLDKSHVTLIANGSHGVLMNWENPMVMHHGTVEKND